ncbi:polyprenyl synthetase family protein [Fonticella tunisiensis]|uniref:Heptaprenyl diphosphate synthase n=1 Tax=Fonticella tunisiensis TaxID=1096341 RepID=A0A4R7KQM5_9CLOT|nr:polyprenyl synthetase family protein [Fonticella tunisiensis]TDT60994.1 heptaprenyl diphosphate synthase [Fonticella tunisiensis]
MSNFWDKYPMLKEDLEMVKNIMRKSVKCNEKLIESALLDLIDSGGKLLRPAFLLLGGRFGYYDQKKLCSLGATIEMLHMATLVHDDILDDAVLRRGSQTIQSKYGKNYAVFMGDYLFSKCFMLLSNNTSIENMKMLSKAVSRICAGEIDQFASQFNQNVSVKKYLKRIGAKTAALFSLSLYIGAEESGCSKKLASKLGRIGYNIGMAFQIIDDLLDYTGDEKVVGKPVGNDLKQGIYTLPLIYALESDKGDIRRMLSKPLCYEDIKNIVKLAKELGGIERARALAKKYTDKAFKDITSLPDGEAKVILMEIAEKLLVRDY